MTQTLEIGQVVAERFQIEALIGEGGMGTIYRARHVNLPRTFAIKLLKSHLIGNREHVARFLREAVAGSQVIHPNVAAITDFGQLEDGTYFIVMEHVEGVGLDEVLQKGPVPLARALEILVQLADALGHAHARGVIHRDLKAENVLLCELRGRRDVVKLVDFGIAQLLGPDQSEWNITKSGQIFGTPEYISPERALDFPTDGRTDLYALGVIAFELATGAPPFTGKPTEVLRAHVKQAPVAPSSRMPGQTVPREFDDLVLKCLAKQPDDRYQTAAEVLRDLLRIRGRLAGMAEHLLSGGRGRGRRPQTSSKWTSLAQRELEAAPPAQSELSGAEQLQALAHAVQEAGMAEAHRRELQNALKELAVSLAVDLRPPELQSCLQEILDLEGEVRELSDQILLLAQQQQRVRSESDEQAVALSHIQADLALEAEASGAGALPPAEREALAARRLRVQGFLDQLNEARDERLDSLGREEARYRQARREREGRLTRLYRVLEAQVGRVRAVLGAGSPAQHLGERLDALNAQLAASQREVTG